MTTHIRPFAPSDRVALIETIEAVCGEGRWMSTPRFQPTPEWLHALAEPGCSCHLLLVVEDAVNIAGWCRLFPIGSQASGLGVGLLPAYRNRGLGTMLVRQALDWALAAGLQRVALTTRQDNTRAIRVFTRRGFAFTGRVDHNAVAMSCELPAACRMTRFRVPGERITIDSQIKQGEAIRG
jgi:ribosomal protein S18 acetylase RimI-like enzyme